MSSIIPPWLRPSKPRTTADGRPGSSGEQAGDAPRGLVIGFWLAVTLSALPLVFGTSWAGPATVLLNLIAVGAVVGGVVRHGPARRLPWVLVAIAIVSWALADRLNPALAGLLYLAGFVALAAALLRLRRADGEGRPAEALLDTLTVTVLLLLFTWLIGATGQDGWSPAIPSPVTYPVGDALLLAAALRLAIIGRPNPAVWSLVAAASAALVADGAVAMDGAGVPGPLSGVAHLGATLAAACLGWAALHPSMARLTEPEPPGDVSPGYLARRLVRRDGRGFTWVLALPALVAPVALLWQALTGDVNDGVILAVVGAALTVLALARVAAAGSSPIRSLEFQTSTDTLTGLASRAYLMWRLTERMEPPWSAVLLVDLDEFRQINEDAGPSVGDAVLVTLAERLRRLAGPNDIVARFGGDEFAILVAGYRDLTALTVDVVAATTEPVLVGGRTFRPSACVGVAVPPGSTARAAPGPITGDRAGRGGGDGGEEMVRRAGMALRAAKAAGPGEWCRYDSDRHALLIERLRLREALIRAVDEGEFRLAYQPIVELASGETVGFEALVRWAHPSRGLVAPAEFIAVAEETGLIEAIGDLVLRTAVAEAVGWPHASIYISVNVSPRQLRRSGFAERVDEVLTTAGLPAERLMLELTESALTRGSDHTWGELAVLRDRGVRLAIDDFGTGFSSLSYLEQTPIGVIKMDKSFVDSLVLSDRQRTVVDGIVSMARNLGLQVVAEGIESSAERDLLAEMSCPYGQGYLYSPPLTSAEVIGWLAHPAVPLPALPAPRPAAESTVEHKPADPAPAGGADA